MYSIKKCKGCGAFLQDDNPQKVGYSVNPEQDYCQRCFRLTHYGDNRLLKLKDVSNDEIYDIYRENKDALFVVIVEAFDAMILNIDDLLSHFKGYKVLLIINKIDLLPANITENKIETIFSKVLSSSDNRNILSCLMTYKNDQSFNELFYETADSLKYKKIVFAGRVNAGKSSLINKLLQNNDLTISPYPGTTLMANEIRCGDYLFIDTPGLNDDKSFVSHLEAEKIKELIPLKTVKARTFQAYSDQSYIVEGILSVNIKTNKNCSCTFYINNMLNIHRTKTENKDSFIANHEKEFKLKLLPFKNNHYKVNKNLTVYLKGLGYIKINGSPEVNIEVHQDIEIYECEVEI
ncbi:MAG: GTPase [Erysipelotrichaceae bacterium]